MVLGLDCPCFQKTLLVVGSAEMKLLVVSLENGATQLVPVSPPQQGCPLFPCSYPAVLVDGLQPLHSYISDVAPPEQDLPCRENRGQGRFRSIADHWGECNSREQTLATAISALGMWFGEWGLIPSSNLWQRDLF